MKGDLVAIYTQLKKAVQLQFADCNYTKYYNVEVQPSGDQYSKQENFVENNLRYENVHECNINEC